MVRRDKSGSEVETSRKRRRNRYRLHTGSLGSTRERDWVVGSQILTFRKKMLKQNHQRTVQANGNDEWLHHRGRGKEKQRRMSWRMERVR